MLNQYEAISRRKHCVKKCRKVSSFTPTTPLKKASRKSRIFNKSRKFIPEINANNKLDNFQNCGLIGTGSFSNVFKTQNISSEIVYALKQSSRSLNTQNSLCDAMNEVEIMEILKNNNHIVNLNDFWISSDQKLCQLYDYYKHGTLLDLIESNKRLNYVQILNILEQICYGLNEIHSSNIIHMDLKPENIFITKDHKLKIGDFGISVNLNKDNNKAQNICSGDPIYIAPELMSFSRNNNDITQKTDIYSAGIILLELLCDIKAPSQGIIFQNLRNNTVDFDILDTSSNNNDYIYQQIGNEIKFLCKSMLQNDPKLRPNSNQILAYIYKILNNDYYKLYINNCESFLSLRLPSIIAINKDYSYSDSSISSLSSPESDKCIFDKMECDQSDDDEDDDDDDCYLEPTDLFSSFM